MNFYIFAVLAAFQAVSKASNPYYYVPPQLQYQIQAPQIPTFNSFSNPFTTSTFYVNPHYQYRSFVPAPIQHYYQPQSYRQPAPVTSSASGYQNNQDNLNNHDYQGFAYHTRNDNGATSHVLFVSGPQSQSIRSTLFPNFNPSSFKTTQKSGTEKAKSYASNMVDSVNKEAEKESQYPKSIQEIYTPPVTVTPAVTVPPIADEQIQQDPAQYFRNFFQRSEAGVVNFYSRNSNLFVRPAPGFAANTFPLTRNGGDTLRESNERFYSPFINPRFEKPEVTTQTTTTEINEGDVKEAESNEAAFNEAELIEVNKKAENVAQESVITNTRFRINEVIDQVEKLIDSNTASSVITSTMSPIVVEDEDGKVSSTMEPIVVQETTTTSVTSTTSSTSTTPSTSSILSTSTTPSTSSTSTTTNPTEETKETTQQSQEVTTTESKSSEGPDFMKTLLALLTSTEQSNNTSNTSETTENDVSTTENAVSSTIKDVPSEGPKDITTDTPEETTSSVTTDIIITN